MSSNEDTREFIRNNYTEIAKGSSIGGCCGGGCSCSAPLNVKEASFKIGYSKDNILNAPIDSNMGLGCGNPIAIAALREGETVLDLGSGGGFDCFLASAKVGEKGFVIGVDMTPEMIKLSRENAEKGKYKNVDFRLGEIEHLPVADETIDVIISNCVINLSLDKQQVFNEAYRVLKQGGRLSVSDVVATSELPENIKHDLALYAGCIAGAESAENIKSMMQNAGFSDVKIKPKNNSREILNSWAPEKNLGDYVGSFIIEAIK